MKKAIWAIFLFVVGITPELVCAQSTAPNHSPVCKAKTVVIGGLDDAVGLPSFSLNPINIAPACTDEDGDTLTLTSVSGPAVLGPNNIAALDFAILPNAVITYDITVSDSQGATTSTTVTVIRN